MQWEMKLRAAGREVEAGAGGVPRLATVAVLSRGRPNPSLAISMPGRLSTSNPLGPSVPPAATAHDHVGCISVDDVHFHLSM